MLQRLRGAQPQPVPEAVRRHGMDFEYHSKLWADEDGLPVEVATLAQADAKAKDSVLAKRLCDEAAASRPLGIQSVN
jgi:hypothetical protein